MNNCKLIFPFEGGISYVQMITSSHLPTQENMRPMSSRVSRRGDQVLAVDSCRKSHGEKSRISSVCCLRKVVLSSNPGFLSKIEGRPNTCVKHLILCRWLDACISLLDVRIAASHKIYTRPCHWVPILHNVLGYPPLSKTKSTLSVEFLEPTYTYKREGLEVPIENLHEHSMFFCCDLLRAAAHEWPVIWQCELRQIVCIKDPWQSSISLHIWVVISNSFHFHPYLGRWSILTNIFQMGWNHQLDSRYYLHQGESQNITTSPTKRWTVLIRDY